MSLFIWNGKPPRIKRSALQRPGLSLPNFIYYYWACNIKTMLHWIGGDRLSGCEVGMGKTFIFRESVLSVPVTITNRSIFFV